MISSFLILIKHDKNAFLKSLGKGQGRIPSLLSGVALLHK
jgi:hypothetical protein